MDVSVPPSRPIPVIVNHPETKDYVQRYKKEVANIFALIQVAIGTLSIMLTITEMAVLGGSCRRTPCVTGYGLWSGVIYFVAGVLGSCSKAFHPNKYLILSFMIMSIISASLSFFPIFFGLSEIRELIWMARSSFIQWRVPENIFVIPIILVVLSFIEVIAAIVSASMCCKAICQCCNEPQDDSYNAFFDIKTQSFVFTLKPKNDSEGRSQSIDASTSGVIEFGGHSKIIPDDSLPILE